MYGNKNIKVNEREVALYAIDEIFKLKAYNNIVLRRVLGENADMSAVQRAFVTELVNGTLRNVITIDYVIDSFSKTKTAKMKPFILNNLRIAVYQLLYTDKVPVSAACNEAVKLAKKHGFTSLSGFVNGVLRNIARNKDNIAFPDEKKKPAEYLSVRYSYSKEIIEYWLESMPYADVKSLCEAGNEAPSVSVMTNTLKTNTASLKAMLEKDGISVRDGNVAKNALILSKTSNIAQTKAYVSGLFHITDESSALAVQVLAPKAGASMLDVCSAPGGKSFSAAYIMENKGGITSRDVYEHKIKLIEDGASRLGINIINAEIRDALKNTDEEKFDYVLVDAPCSGLGLMRKKPDIKYGKTREDIESLAKLQREILSATAKAVKHGGFLVYSTCTISPEENEKNAAWFADNFDFEFEDISELVPDRYKAEGKTGMVHLLPGTDGTDGFFISKFRRK